MLSIEATAGEMLFYPDCLIYSSFLPYCYSLHFSLIKPSRICRVHNCLTPTVIGCIWLLLKSCFTRDLYFACIPCWDLRTKVSELTGFGFGISLRLWQPQFMRKSPLTPPRRKQKVSKCNNYNYFWFEPGGIWELIRLWADLIQDTDTNIYLIHFFSLFDYSSWQLLCFCGKVAIYSWVPESNL